MARRRMLVLASIGLVLIFISLLLILYTYWSFPEIVETVPVAPTLFAPP